MPSVQPKSIAPQLASYPRARMWVRPTWSGPGGASHLLVVSFPLVLSAFSAVINLFLDRWFLARYDQSIGSVSLENMTAAMSGMMWWTIQHFGTGIVSYVGTFVAQYHGANRPGRIGASLWQAIYLAIFAGVINFALFPLYDPFFRFVHGDNSLARLEADYCEVLSFGSLFLMVSTALSFFFTGRGKTRLVMLVSFLAAGVNIVLNRWWIFNPPDWLPFLEPGIVGAAWATNVSFLVGVLVYGAVAFSTVNERRFATRSAWRFDWALLRRLIRYGLPQGTHLVIEVAAWSFFFLMIGRLDSIAYTAANIAFTLNITLFVPMLSIAQGVGILMGQFIGSDQPDKAEKSTCLGMLLTFVMMLAAAACYIFIPQFLVGIFTRYGGGGELTDGIRQAAELYLIFVAVYSIADVFGVVYASAIKGAGDTKFVMTVAVICSVTVLVIPTTLAAIYKWPVWTLWFFATGFIYCTATLYVARYYSGRWKTMKVIEPEIAATDDFGRGGPETAIAT